MDRVGAILLHVDQPIHEAVNLRARVLAAVELVPGGHDPLDLLRGVVALVDGGAGHAGVSDGDIVVIFRPQGVHQGRGGCAAVLAKVVGVGGFLREQHFLCFRIDVIRDLGIEIRIGTLGFILAAHHLVAHVLRDGKDFGGGEADVQVVAVDAVLHILQGLRGRDLHFLIIGQHGSTGSDVLLTFLAENSHQNLHHSGLLGFVLFQLLGNRQLTHGVGQQPVVLGGFSEIGQHDAVYAVLLDDVLRQSGRVAEHGRLTIAELLGDDAELQLVVAGLEAYILQELLVLLKHPGPDGIVQSDLVLIRFAFVVHAPLGALQAHQIRDGAALHGLQTAVVVKPVGLEALDAYFLEGVDRRHEFGIIGGQGDVVLIEQILVGHDGVHFGAHGQPANGATVLLVDLQIAGVECACHLGLAQIHQVRGQRSCVVQREAAAGDDVRHGLAPGQQILVVFHGVVALNECEIDVGELLLQPGRQLLEHGSIPQIHGDGNPVALFRLFAGRVLACTSGERCDDHERDQQHAQYSSSVHE